MGKKGSPLKQEDQREAKGSGNSGKAYHKNLPQKSFGPHPTFGIGKGALLEKRCFKNVHVLEILENLFQDSKDSRKPQEVENKGEPDHFLEILEKIARASTVAVAIPTAP